MEMVDDMGAEPYPYYKKVSFISIIFNNHIFAHNFIFFTMNYMYSKQIIINIFYL